MHAEHAGRLHFDRLHKSLFGQPRRHAHHHVRQCALRWNHVRRGDLQDEVGRADLPALDGLRPVIQCRFRRVACGRAFVHPTDDGCAVVISQRAVVRKHRTISVRWRGRPRRHQTVGDYLANHRGLARNLVVRFEAEGGRPAFAMTLETVLRDERRDVLVIRRRRRAD
ncbi:MAG: hypothetical protein SGJ11_14095 [Phycisphaerae bacterium]|nr:hypothetical protein [Phycisphaerae bacterium]